MASAGDVNGDGFGDVIVGDYGTSSKTGAGAHVYLGSTKGVSTKAATTLVGGPESDWFGGVVSGAGDVNGDGYDDVLVTAEGYGSRAGRVYVFAGSAGGVSSTPLTTLTGEARSDRFGRSAAGAGDVNADGYDDIVVGAYAHGGETGRVYVFAGSASGVARDALSTLDGNAPSDHFGWAVSGAGDVNGDGYADVVVGGSKSNLAGGAYVFAGSAAGLGALPQTTLSRDTSVTAIDGFGYSVSGAGDVNGDGYDDVIVGAIVYASYVGGALVYLGSASGVAEVATTIVTGVTRSGIFGWSVGGAGDLDGDGYDEVVVGAPQSGKAAGALVHVGSAGGTVGTPGVALYGENTFDYFGVSVSGAGDVDGDGAGDLIVGAGQYMGYEGRAYIYHGIRHTGGGDSGDTAGDTGDTTSDTADTAGDTDDTAHTADTAAPTQDTGLTGRDTGARPTASGCGCATGAEEGGRWWVVCLGVWTASRGLRRR